MCLAVPAKIIGLEGSRATVEVPGNRFQADVTMVDVSVGDYVLVHAGFAIERYDPEVAKELLQLWEDVADAE